MKNDSRIFFGVWQHQYFGLYKKFIRCHWTSILFFGCLFRTRENTVPMNTPASTPSATIDQQDPRLILRRARQEAVKKAQTVREFGTRYHQILDGVLGGRMPENGDGASLTPVTENVREQASVLVAEERKRIDDVLCGNEGMSLKDLEPGHLGYNRLGGGKGSAVLSKDLFAELEDDAAAKIARQVAAHEAAHGEQVAGLPIELLEGHAEVSGNEAVGEDAHYHRSGQPDVLYREGQELAATIIRHTSRARFEEVMTKTGDIDGLLADIEDRKTAYEIAVAISEN